MTKILPVDKICEKVKDMAGMVESAIASAILTFVETDPNLASDVRTEDFEIHQLWLQLDRECNEALVNLHEPNLEKVKFITGVMKIGLDIKRISDEAKTILDRCRQLRRAPLTPKATGIPHMSELAQAMLSDAVEAFVNKDPREAKSLFLLKRQLMDLKSDTISEITAQMEKNPDLVQAGIQVALIARSLTKIGEFASDMAMNIVHIFVENPEAVFETEEQEAADR